MLMLMLTTAGTTLMIINGASIETTHVVLRQSHHNDGHIVGGVASDSTTSNAHCCRPRGGQCDGCGVLWTGGLIDLITHHIAVELEHVQLAHGAGSVLDQPGINAVLVELVSAKESLVRPHPFGHIILVYSTYLQGNMRIISAGLYDSMQMAQQSLSTSFSSVILPVFVGIFMMAFFVTEQRLR